MSPPARVSASKCQSHSKEQQIKDEASAERSDSAGLRVAAVKEKDFDLMMETVDREVTEPKGKKKKQKKKTGNLIDSYNKGKVQKSRRRLAAVKG